MSAPKSPPSSPPQGWTSTSNLVTREIGFAGMPPVITRVSKLLHDGRVMMTLEGPTSDTSLAHFAKVLNARRTRPWANPKVFADFASESARSKRSAAKASQICGPEFDPDTHIQLSDPALI